jgi:hypothetical protein
VAARTTNADIVGANDFAFAKNPRHYQGQVTANLANDASPLMTRPGSDDPIEPIDLANVLRTACGRSTE